MKLWILNIFIGFACAETIPYNTTTIQTHNQGVTTYYNNSGKIQGISTDNASNSQIYYDQNGNVNVVNTHDAGGGDVYSSFKGGE